jgi:hypothetical protein
MMICAISPNYFTKRPCADYDFMTMSTQLVCDTCGQLAAMEMQAYVGPYGKRIEWPMAEAKDGQLCFTIACPNCGARQQCIAPSAAK